MLSLNCTISIRPHETKHEPEKSQIERWDPANILMALTMQTIGVTKEKPSPKNGTAKVSS